MRSELITISQSNMEIVLYFLAFLLSITLFANEPTQGLVVHWDTFDCVVNPSFVVFHRCIIIEPERTLITTEVKYNRDFEQINANLIVELPRPPSNKYHKIMNLNVDVCQLYKASKRNKFINIAYQTIIKGSNLSLKCPQRKGLYSFPNMNIGPNLPPFLPKTNFKAHLNFFLPKTHLINVSLSGRTLDFRKLNS